MHKQYPQAKSLDGSWTLEPNAVWSIPDGVHEVRGEMDFGPRHVVRSYRALATDKDGYIYGIRALSKPKGSGYVLEGHISIDGKKIRAFTSSTLFQRPDGSLVDVAILYVCNGEPPIPLPNLDEAPDEVLEELTHKYHYSSPDGDGKMSSRALIYEYAYVNLGLRHGWAKQYPHVHYPERLEEVYQQLPEWAKFRR